MKGISIFRSNKAVAINPKTSEEKQATKEKRPVGRPKKYNEDGTPITNTHTSVVFDKQQFEKIKQIALNRGLTIKDVLTQMLAYSLKHYEKKYGEVVIKPNTSSKKALFD